MSVPHRASITPTVTLLTDLAHAFETSKWRNGQVVVSRKDSVLEPSSAFRNAAELATTNPRATLARVPATSGAEACLDGKEEWGTHVAAHPCRPDWTRETVSTFVQSVVNMAPNS